MKYLRGIGVFLLAFTLTLVSAGSARAATTWVLGFPSADLVVSMEPEPLSGLGQATPTGKFFGGKYFGQNISNDGTERLALRISFDVVSFDANFYTANATLLPSLPLSIDVFLSHDVMEALRTEFETCPSWLVPRRASDNSTLPGYSGWPVASTDHLLTPAFSAMVQSRDMYWEHNFFGTPQFSTVSPSSWAAFQDSYTTVLPNMPANGAYTLAMESHGTYQSFDLAVLDVTPVTVSFDPQVTGSYTWPLGLPVVQTVIPTLNVSLPASYDLVVSCDGSGWVTTHTVAGVTIAVAGNTVGISGTPTASFDATVCQVAARKIVITGDGGAVVDQVTAMNLLSAGSFTFAAGVPSSAAVSLSPATVSADKGTPLTTGNVVSVAISGDAVPFNSMTLTYGGATGSTVTVNGMTATADPVTGMISVTGTPVAAGVYTVNVDVTGALAGTMPTTSFNIVVTAPGSVVTIPPVSVVVGGVVPPSAAVVVSGETLPYVSMTLSHDIYSGVTSLDLASGLVITTDPLTGTLNFSGTATVPGDYYVDVTVESPAGIFNTETMLIHVDATAIMTLNPTLVTALISAGAYSGDITVTTSPVLSLTALSTDITSYNGLTITCNPTTGKISIAGTPTMAGTTTVTVSASSGAYTFSTKSFILSIMDGDTTDMFDMDRVKLFDETWGREYLYDGSNLYTDHNYQIFFRGDLDLISLRSVEIRGPRDLNYNSMVMNVDYWTNYGVQWDDWDPFDGDIYARTLHISLPTRAQGRLYSGTYYVRLTYDVKGMVGGPFTQVMTFNASTTDDSGGKGGDGSSGGCNAGFAGLAMLGLCLSGLLRRKF